MCFSNRKVAVSKLNEVEYQVQRFHTNFRVEVDYEVNRNCELSETLRCASLYTKIDPLYLSSTSLNKVRLKGVTKRIAHQNSKCACACREGSISYRFTKRRIKGYIQSALSFKFFECSLTEITETSYKSKYPLRPD